LGNTANQAICSHSLEEFSAGKTSALAARGSVKTFLTPAVQSPTIRRSTSNRDVKIIRNILAAIAALALCANLSSCGSASAAQSAPADPAPASSPAPSAPATPNCTVQTGSFQLVATGFAADTVGEALYKFFPCEKYAMIFLPALAGASNDVTFTASPLPDLLIPATIPFQEASVHGYDNGVEQALMSVHISAGSNVMTYLRNGEDAGWTASGNKGVGLQVIAVFLD
jgi:hypothetical protein